MKRLQRQHPHLSVGVLSANLLDLKGELQMLKEVGVKYLHFDVMDGHFSPRLTAGAPLIKAIAKDDTFLIDAHLMMAHPLKHLADILKAGAHLITIHAESADPEQLLQCFHKVRQHNQTHATNVLIGLALIPSTPLSVLQEMWEEIDLVNLLAVDPTQPTFPCAPWEQFEEKVQRVRQLQRERPSHKVLMQLDGGVTRDNFSSFARLKPDLLVSGSALFQAPNPRQAIASAQKELQLL